MCSRIIFTYVLILPSIQRPNSQNSLAIGTLLRRLTRYNTWRLKLVLNLRYPSQSDLISNLNELAEFAVFCPLTCFCLFFCSSLTRSAYTTSSTDKLIIVGRYQLFLAYEPRLRRKSCTILWLSKCWSIVHSAGALQQQNIYYSVTKRVFIAKLSKKRRGLQVPPSQWGSELQEPF